MIQTLALGNGFYIELVNSSFYCCFTIHPVLWLTSISTSFFAWISCSTVRAHGVQSACLKKVVMIITCSPSGQVGRNFQTLYIEISWQSKLLAFQLKKFFMALTRVCTSYRFNFLLPSHLSFYLFSIIYEAINSLYLHSQLLS